MWYGIRNEETGRVFFKSTNRALIMRLALTSPTLTGTPVQEVFGVWAPLPL